MTTATDPDQRVVEFDRMAEIYEAFVQPFSGPIFDEALRVIGPYLRKDSRALDVGCGSGRELRAVARLAPRGEVVGVDLAGGMVKSAFRAARAHGIDNCAFFQSDASSLPEAFTGRFDVAYSCLAHHHYPDPPAAASSILRCLRPGGLYFVVDPGPAWFNALAKPLASVADPGWVGFHTPRGFIDLFRSVGFSRSSWVSLLPGFGVAIGQKASSTR
jgi:SAM-dependent methyltransferase